MSGCRIKKVKFKSGGSIEVLPASVDNYARVCFGWGEVTIRDYDNKPLTVADQCYMLDAAKQTIISGD